MRKMPKSQVHNYDSNKFHRYTHTLDPYSQYNSVVESECNHVCQIIGRGTKHICQDKFHVHISSHVISTVAKLCKLFNPSTKIADAYIIYTRHYFSHI